MKCEICKYNWTPRIVSPKSCPRCKRRFDYFNIKNVVGVQNG